MTRSFTYPEDMYLPGGMMGSPSYTRAGHNWFEPVDKHNYPSNMTMTIRLLDGEAVVDTCQIAAFVEDECRGAVRADGEGLYYLVIAGEGAGQAMEIKTVINDQMVNDEMVNVITIDNTLTYVSDDHIGTPWEPYVIQLRKAEGIDAVSGDPSSKTATKVLEDQHIYIIRNGEKYTVTGQEVK
jgi:hypothetical protein